MTSEVGGLIFKAVLAALVAVALVVLAYTQWCPAAAILAAALVAAWWQYGEHGPS